MESPEWTYEEGDALAEGTIETTSSRKTSANPAEPIKKTRLFSLASSPYPTATTAVNESGSTQVDTITSPFHSSKNINYSNLSFVSDYPSQRFRPEVYEEEDPADPYYSPPSTFIPSESPYDVNIQDQTSSTVHSSEAQVRKAYLSIVNNTNIQNLRQCSLHQNNGTRNQSWRQHLCQTISTQE